MFSAVSDNISCAAVPDSAWVGCKLTASTAQHKSAACQSFAIETVFLMCFCHATWFSRSSDSLWAPSKSALQQSVAGA
jgi:hypothetical protein